MTRFHHLRIKLENFAVKTRYGRYLVQPSTGLFQASANLGILGPSGAGKTIFFKAICQLLPPELTSSGVASLYINDQPVEPINVVMIPQAVVSSIPRGISLGYLLELSIKRSSASEKRQVNELLEMVSLPVETKKLQASQLSGGMAQRFSVALAISTGKPIVVLDEPSTGLDELTMLAVIAAINKASIDVAFLICSHDEDFLAKTTSERISFSSDGRIYFASESIALSTRETTQ